MKYFAPLAALPLPIRRSIPGMKNVCQKQHNLCVTINTHMRINWNNIG
jgi:hypothetical protein